MVIGSSSTRKLFSHTLSFLFVVSSTLIANWLWQNYTNRIDLKNAQEEEKQVFLGIMHRVIVETEYNCSAGIGDSKCPFKLDAHHELLSTPLTGGLSKNAVDLAKEIIRLGSLCNGGRTGRKVTPAAVKGKCLALKEELERVVVSEPFQCSA